MLSRHGQLRELPGCRGQTSRAQSPRSPWRSDLARARPSGSFLGRRRGGKRVFRSFDQPKALLVAQRQEGGLEILPAGDTMRIESAKTPRRLPDPTPSGRAALPPRLPDLSFRREEFRHLTRMRIPERCPLQIQLADSPRTINFFRLFARKNAKTRFSEVLSFAMVPRS